MRIRLLLILTALAATAALVAPATALESNGIGKPGVLVLEDGEVLEPVRPAYGDESSPIRPGASMGGCTYNFLYHQLVYPTPENPHPVPKVYIGTAGHCTTNLGDRVTLPGVGQIGTVVYDSDRAGSAVDFSLIRLDAELVSRANPKMLGNNGPVGSIQVSQLTRGDRVNVYGYGVVVGSFQQTRSRFGFLVNWNNDEYVADMPAVNGDSGAPLLHDTTGRALGIISRYGFTAIPPSTDVGPMMPWIFRELGKSGFGDVVLSTVN